MKTSWVKDCLEMVAGDFLSSRLTSTVEPLLHCVTSHTILVYLISRILIFT